MRMDIKLLKKLDQMIYLGHCPIVMKNGGDLTVSFPVEAEDFFTEDELELVKDYIIKQEKNEI